MQCQLDQVGEILNIAAAAGDSVEKKMPGCSALHLGRTVSPVIYGLLLLKEYDVFMQKGLVNSVGEKTGHFWIEVYFEGEPFILDAAAGSFEDGGGKGDILFMPKDEACERYGYDQGTDREWNPKECDRGVLRLTMDTLGIHQEVDFLLEEISEYNDI
ncbi:MAG: hypothetical protein JL50_00055 [Peptococcaceae bacterium BICA1-7]|nr:MAG: hypothetical protein JL50_00055 [Peptococcaceae bacterium BICA1-7]HBV98225.1 hypothetical protein [Desulfotomaculum sp.]